MPFPTIRHINDVLPAIQGRDEFTVGIRDGYQFIDYNYSGSDTFDCPIRRECRGLKFDMDGKLIARPFHKFFNLHEKPSEVPTLSGDNHTIMEKLDGSMIHAAILGGKIVWMTRAGITDQALQAQSYVSSLGLDQPDYHGLAYSMIRAGFTPIFEYTSPSNQIVIRYSDTNLTLIAARYRNTGFYMADLLLQDWAKDYDVPVVRTFDPTHNLDEFVAYAKSLTDTEGFVIRCGDWTGKVKADAYVASHRAKSGLLWEKDVFRLVLEQKVDDVCGLLPKDEADKLDEWAATVNAGMRLTADCLWHAVQKAPRHHRKVFAEHITRQFNFHGAKYAPGICFQIYDGADPLTAVRAAAMKQTTSTQKARNFLESLAIPAWVPTRIEAEA